VNAPFRALGFLALLGLAACTTPGSPQKAPAPPNSVAQWKNGEFTVVFRAGPRTFGEERSFSSYEVSRKIEPYSGPLSIAIESAFNISHFLWDSKSRPEKFIQTRLSPSGETLLIAEEIPNDCAPCVNFILVRTEKDGLSSEYLTLPERMVRPNDVFAEIPQVQSISDTSATVRYSDGVQKTLPFAQLVKKNRRPTFPG